MVQSRSKKLQSIALLSLLVMGSSIHAGRCAGPVAAAWAYSITKGFCYATAIVGLGTVGTVATVGLAPVAAAGGVLAGGSALATAGGLSGTVAAASGLVAANTAIASTAALGTAGVVTGAGSLTAAVTAVEVASITVSMPFLACPFLP